jgi:hypothetical protein
MSSAIVPTAPEVRYDPRLVEVLTDAVSRFYAELDQQAPFLAPKVRTWIDSLYGGVPLADAFRLPAAYPMILLPWILEQTLRGEPDSAFQRDLAFSSINGYHYVRLLDDVMDREAPPPAEILPILGFFYYQAHAPYQGHFPYDHPFWTAYAACWFRTAEVTARDAGLGKLDRALFVEVAAQKTSAARIPLAAVCWKYGRADLFETWGQFHSVFGCWHQMNDDVRDWQTDHLHGNATYFLSEAACRKDPAESVPEWIVREGYAWAVGALRDWMVEMKAEAVRLSSPALQEYLEARERLQNEQHELYLEVLPYLARTLDALKYRDEMEWRPVDQ